MSVESNISFVAELNELYPRKNDLIKEGDDHIRLVKRVLKSTFPGFKNAISITSDKLNLVDQTIEIDSQGLTINKPLKMGPKATINLSGNKLAGLPEPVEDADPVTLKYLKKLFQDITWPVGSLYFTDDATNPAVKFGFGTWVPWGAGRAIVASGASTDAAGESRSFANGVVGGNFQKTLTVNNMPNHTHNIGGVSISVSGEHSHQTDWPLVGEDGVGSGNIASGGWGGAEDTFRQPTKTSGAHTHSLSGSVDSTGSGQSFEIIQPYIVCNVWKRTA